MNQDSARQSRLAAWCQDGIHRIEDSNRAADFINKVGIATLYPASPEFPSLLLGYLSATTYVSNPSWDSPGGHVYGWRWELGKPAAAFYSSIVAKKPTWVAWPLLPAVLSALMTREEPEELYTAGKLSREAMRVYEALDGAAEPLVTGELRKAAGFPTGKEHRVAYLRGVAELEERLLLAKVFGGDRKGEGDGDEMSHALISRRYPKAHAEALSHSPEEGLRKLVENHVRISGYIDIPVFARHLRVPKETVAQIASSLSNPQDKS